jgi:hypothetical protein
MFTTISIVVAVALLTAVVPFIASYHYYARAEQGAREVFSRAPKPVRREYCRPSTLTLTVRALSTFNSNGLKVDRDTQRAPMVGRGKRKRSWLAAGIASLMLASLFFPQAALVFARDAIASVHKLFA